MAFAWVLREQSPPLLQHESFPPAGDEAQGSGLVQTWIPAGAGLWPQDSRLGESQPPGSSGPWKMGAGDARHPGPSLAPVRTTLVRKRGVNCEEDVREVQGDTMSERHRVRREVDLTSIWRCLPQELPREALIPRTCGANSGPRGPGSRPDSRPFRGSGRTATRVEARWLCAGGGGLPPAPGGVGRGREARSLFPEGSILGRWAQLSSASTLLFKGVLPLFLSLTNLVTPPSCTSAYHSGATSRTWAPRGAAPEGHLQPGSSPLSPAGQGEVPQLTLQPCKAGMRKASSQVLPPAALQRQKQARGSQLEPAPYNPARQRQA